MIALGIINSSGRKGCPAGCPRIHPKMLCSKRDTKSTMNSFDIYIYTEPIKTRTSKLLGAGFGRMLLGEGFGRM